MNYCVPSIILVCLLNDYNAIQYSQIINTTGPEQFVDLTAADFGTVEEFENVDVKQVILDELARNGEQLSSDVLRSLQNPTQGYGKIEGDIDLPSDSNVDFSDSNYWNLAYSAVVDNRKRWPNGIIPYKISTYYRGFTRSMIGKAIKHFHGQTTCLKFVPRTNETDYIFIRPILGCSSQIGRTGGQQDVSLDVSCFANKHLTVVHELMHAAGFYHEQSRYDRDNHVLIHWNNIEPVPGIKKQFEKKTESVISLLGMPYDQHSIMHYKANEFSVSPNLLKTISAKDGGTLSNDHGLTDIDVMKINSLYDCDESGKYQPEIKCKIRLHLENGPELKSQLIHHYTHRHNDNNVISDAVQIIKSFDNADWFAVSCSNKDDVSYNGFITVNVDDRQYLFNYNFNVAEWYSASEGSIKSYLKSIQWTTKSSSGVSGALYNQFSEIWFCIISSKNDTNVYGDGHHLIVRVNNGSKFITVFN